MSETKPEISIPEKFQDIAPYDDGAQFRERLESLVREPGFRHAVEYVMPGVNYDDFARKMLSVESRYDFQVKIMGPFLEMLAKKTSDGLSMDGTENCDPGQSYTFISNHRDIVLDASFLNLCLIRHHLPLTQVAIGNNLLIYEWITDLVKINRSFIVKRDVRVSQALEAARQLSEYIHFAINEKHESVWIAQREGRAKDSNDMTQESLIKMLSLGGEGTVKEHIMGVNLLPVAISYEYDPNDYLKATEFLLRRRDPDFKKSQHDDLLSMETGLLGAKGRIHFHMGRPINAELAKFDSDNRAEIVKHTCALIDRNIHCGYKIYPGNYIAYDELMGENTFAGHYTEADYRRFNDYVEHQLSLVKLPDITAEEHAYLRSMILNMYANPLKNQLAASAQCASL